MEKTVYDDENATLSALVAKTQTDAPFTRAELLYLAEKIQRGMAQYRRWYSHVRKSLIAANLRAFGAFMGLRDDLYPEDCSEDTREYVDVERAEWLLRSLAVALRNEPAVPEDRLNQVMAPYKTSLVQAALRVQYLKTAQPLGLMQEAEAQNIPYPPVKMDDIEIALSMCNGEMFAISIIHSHDLELWCHNPAEIDDLVLLLDAMEAEPTLETRVAGKWGATVVADPPCSVNIFGANWSLYIKVPGCRIRFSKEQVDTLRAALHTALARPEVAAVMTAQAFRYGVV